MIVSVHTDYFLCHIRITLYIVLSVRKHIFTVSRYMDCQLVPVYRRCKVEILHNADNVFFRYGDAKHAVYLGDADLHFDRLNGVTGVDIYMCGRNLTTLQFFDQM